MPAFSKFKVVACLLLLAATSSARGLRGEEPSRPKIVTAHPRLYFRAEDLPRLRGLKSSGVHARIWKNLAESADWCASRVPRKEWIPTITPDPIFENLYDRFYAAMHDSAIVEHLAFASVLSDPGHDPYFTPARDWALATASVWRNEATNKPDASKAYSVLRVVKALAVAYDLLHDRLSAEDRQRIRDTIVAVGREYFVFFADPIAAGEGYNKHHGSVDAAPFGVAALALLGEVPEANEWLERMVRKHVDYLLPFALTPSGTSDQSSNFWASTLHYRIFFMDALRRVTGRDLFREFPGSMPGRIALAAVAGPQPLGLAEHENHRSVLFGPSYGQLDYWAPALLFLAREQRRPIYQHLALWDAGLGRIQRSRYITPNRKEELLFTFAGYSYVWYDPTVPAEIEPNLPRSFEFPEPEVNEAYLRDSFEPGGIVVGMKKGSLVVHAGGRPVLVDRLQDDVNNPSKPVEEMLVADDGRLAFLRCVGPKPHGVGEQRIELNRPGKLTIRREAAKPLGWWHAGDAKRTSNTLTWPNGTRLTVTRGAIESIDPKGHADRLVHYARMKYADPLTLVYPVVTVRPDGGHIEISIETETK